jgi:hypothetical protein
MSRAGAIIVGAVALLLGNLSGCILDANSLNIFVASSEREWVMEGSLESVSAATQKALGDMRATTDVVREGDAVRIKSFTTGTESKRFTLVLTRVKGPNGDQTRIRIEWGEDGVDSEFWHKLPEDIYKAKAASAFKGERSRNSDAARIGNDDTPLPR